MAGLRETLNQGSRVFHVMMVIPAGLLLLLLSLISLSTLTTTNKRFTDEYAKANYEEESNMMENATCVLYTETEGTNDMKVFDYNTDGEECRFSIAGGGILAVIAIALSVVLVVKAVANIDVVSHFALIELGISAFGSVLAFIVSVVITAGLEKTCKAFTELDSDLKDYPCCSYFFEYSAKRVYFYEGINSSRITAWFAMALLLSMTGLYVCIFLMHLCRNKSTNLSCSGTICTGKTKGALGAAEKLLDIASEVIPNEHGKAAAKLAKGVLQDQAEADEELTGTQRLGLAAGSVIQGAAGFAGDIQPLADTLDVAGGIVKVQAEADKDLSGKQRVALGAGTAASGVGGLESLEGNTIAQKVTELVQTAAQDVPEEEEEEN